MWTHDLTYRESQCERCERRTYRNQANLRRAAEGAPAEQWAQYYASVSSSGSRRDLARRLRRLKERGEVRFVAATEPDEALRITERTMEQKSRRFIRTGAPDVFARSDHRRFFSRMATECLDGELVKIFALYCEEEILATSWTLLADGWLAGLVQVIDFSVGDEPYKSVWCDERTTLSEYFAATSLLGRTYTMPRIAQRRAKRSAMELRPVARFARAAKRRVRAARP